MSDSSTDTELEQKAPEREDVTTADSSTAEDDQSGETVLDAVKAALDTEEAPASRTQESETDESDPGQPAAEKGEADEITEEEIEGYAPKTQKRIRQLLAERKDLSTRLEDYEPKAQQFDRLVGVMQSSNLSSEDVDAGFEIMGLMKNDPEKALERLTPLYAQLVQITGHVLPDDLKQDVSLGYISEARAAELARARASGDISRARHQYAEQTRQQETQRQQSQAHVQSVAAAADKWAQTKAAKDPDWNLKQSRVTELVELEIRRSGFPPTPEAAVALSDKALQRVEQEMKRWRPHPTAVRSVTGAASTQQPSQPATLLDAVKQAAHGG